MKNTDTITAAAATGGGDTLERRWPDALKNERARLKQRRHDSPLTKDPTGAEREVRERRQALSGRATELEDAFWGAMGERLGGQPYFSRTSFSAAGCAASPALSAARAWFRVLAELDAFDQAVKQAGSSAGTSSLKALRAVWDIQDDYEMADFVWQEHCRCYKSFGAEEAERVIADWVAVTLGTAYVLREFQRVSPDAGRAELLSEIRGETRAVTTREALVRVTVRLKASGQVVGELTARRPDSGPFTDVPVTDLTRTPARVATGLRRGYADSEREWARLLPATRPQLADLNASAPDPQDVFFGRVVAEEITEQINLLPPKQRQAVELFSEGHSREAIAERMGVGPESVKTHLKLAMAKLRKALNPEPDPAHRSAALANRRSGPRP